MAIRTIWKMGGALALTTAGVAAWVRSGSRRALEERTAFLAEAGTVLASSLDYEAILANLARLVVPRIADDCAIFEVVGREIRQIAVAHADPGKENLVQQLGDLYRAIPEDSDNAVARAVRTGRSELLHHAGPAGWPDVGEELGEIYARLDRRSSMVLPLAARGQIVGVLFLASSVSGRTFGAEDLALGEDLARRAALAVDNGRLYREIHAANEAKDRFLATLSHELRTPLTPVLAVVSGLRDEPGLSEEVRRRLDGLGLRGIALSGYGTEEDVRRSLEAGFAEHLTKPVAFQALQAAIRRAAGQALPF